MDKHLISVNIEAGITDNVMVRMILEDAMREVCEKAPKQKADCWLISNGYSISTSRYERKENNFQWIDTVLLDVDNKSSDPNLLNEFRDEYSNYEYWLWETASSKPECPKFRVIFPLDKHVEWINSPSKITKNAIKQHFGKYTDDNASWYFSPVSGKLDTVIHHIGHEYPSSKLLSEMDEIKHNMETSLLASNIRQSLQSYRGGIRERNPDGWRFIPCVKKCLDGLSEGERDKSLHAACWVMDKYGYKDKIPQFLDEVVCDRSVKAKFYRRFK